MAPYRWQVAATLAMVVPMFLLELAPAWIIKIGLDRVVGPAQTAAGAVPHTPGRLEFLFEPPLGMPALAWLATLYLLAMLASAALQFANAVLMSLTGQAAMRDLRRDVFGHIQKLHLGFFDRYPVGRLVTRATNDVENIAEMFSSGIVALVDRRREDDRLRGGAVPGRRAPRARRRSWWCPILAACAVAFRRGMREAFRKVRVRIARINATMQETVTGMKVVQLFTREARNQREFEAMNAEHRDAWIDSIRYDAALFAAVEIAGGISVAVIVGYGAGFATAGTLYVFIDWMRRFFMPLRDLSAKYSVMQSSMASSRAHLPAASTPSRRSAISMRNWSDHGRSAGLRAWRRAAKWSSTTSGSPTSDEDWMLKDVSFRVAPGEKVALVGSTGAGKTSIIKLLTRLYEVNRGAIRLDGVDLRDAAAARAAPAHRDGAPGRVPVQRHGRIEHRARAAAT